MIKKRINYKIKDNFLNNNVFIGDTMYILNYPAFEVKIVSLSSWSKDFLDMELLATHIPELVIQSKNIVYLGDNNYILAEKNKRYFTQACLISSENFFYKPVVTKKEVKRFNQISSWKKLYNKLSIIIFYLIEEKAMVAY